MNKWYVFIVLTTFSMAIQAIPKPHTPYYAPESSISFKKCAWELTRMGVGLASMIESAILTTAHIKNHNKSWSEYTLGEFFWIAMFLCPLLPGATWLYGGTKELYNHCIAKKPEQPNTVKGHLLASFECAKQQIQEALHRDKELQDK